MPDDRVFEDSEDGSEPSPKAVCTHPNLIEIGAFFKCPDCGMSGFVCRRGATAMTGSAGARVVKRKDKR